MTETTGSAIRSVVFNPRVLGGKPFIAGTRISVECILELLASGKNINDILAAHPQLSHEGIRDAILFASDNLKNDIFLSAELS